MSKSWDTSGLGTLEWLWATLKQNPEGWLLLVAGSALLLRRGWSNQGTQYDTEYVQRPVSGIARKQKTPALGPHGAGPFAAESGAEQLESQSKFGAEQRSEEAKAAKAILDAQQKAVEDIRAGRPAPYYFTAPQSSVRSQDTAHTSANDADRSRSGDRTSQRFQR